MTSFSRAQKWVDHAKHANSIGISWYVGEKDIKIMVDILDEYVMMQASLEHRKEQYQHHFRRANFLQERLARAENIAAWYAAERDWIASGK